VTNANLIVATKAKAVDRLAVGMNYCIPTAESAQTLAVTAEASWKVKGILYTSCHVNGSEWSSLDQINDQEAEPKSVLSKGL